MNSRDNSDNYICRAVTENPGYMQVKFRVPKNVEIFCKKGDKVEGGITVLGRIKA